jgi:hypothetical protein
MAGENMDRAKGLNVVALAGVGTTTPGGWTQVRLYLNNINLAGGKK